MNKRILSILLCVAMVAAMLVLAIPASAEGTPTVTVTPAETEAKPGDEIEFTVAIGPFTGIGPMSFALDIPEGLTYVSGSLTPDSGLQSALNLDSMSMPWVNDTKREFGQPAAEAYESSTDLPLCSFKVTVDDGFTGPAKVDLKELEFLDGDFEDVTVDVVPAVVKLAETPTEAPATEAPATEAPATEAPATEAPATEAPATEAPATEAPVTPTEAPHVHNLVYVAEKPATYEEDGVKAHYVCTDCGLLFSDGTERVEVAEADLVIPKLVPTEAPATEAPATEAPATEAPATEAPATEAPATEAPATEAPATEAPATEAPATEAPATEAPATEAPATEAPATEAPATEAPATEAPATEAPATEAPATEAPATEAPATEAPATEAPTTVVAPTQAATTAATKDTATKDTSTATTSSPKTGDSTHMTLWMFIMLVSLVGAGVVLYAAKRKGIFTK